VTVSVDVSPDGSGTVEVDGNAPSCYPDTVDVKLGTRIQLEAVPESGYHFVKWDEEPTIDTENPVEVNVIRKIKITAVFAPDGREFTSEDGVIDIFIPDETTALDGDGNPLADMEFAANETPPPYQDGEIIGTAYNIEPSGATFEPPVALTWYYDSADVPSGVAEDDLSLAYYDEDVDEWVDLPSDVDTGVVSVTALVEHLTTFAIVVFDASPPPPPDAFILNSLSISPPEVNVGKLVTISIPVTNTSEETGSYTVTLKINGVIEKTKGITLAGGSEQTVTFTTSRDEVGTYSVDVNGLSGSFRVKEAASPPAPPPPTSSSMPPTKTSWLIGGIIAAGVIGITVPLVLRWRRRRDDYDSADKYVSF